MAVLVCGGAGYIGSHCVFGLIEKGEQVVVVDNLSNGHLDAIPGEARFYEGDIRDMDFMDRVFQENDITEVIHFAANSLVGESMTDPLKYYENNVYGTMVLLQSMIRNKVEKIVFSSTAAVYGEPKRVPILEDDETNPTNTYGETKLAMEKMMKWTDTAHGVRYVSLRYFNVAGAQKDGVIGEDHHPETHLIPLVLQVPLGKREKIMVYGDDYATADGTCIRDYIHVEDLIDGHLKALQYLREGNRSNIFNLGNGTGFSVNEIISAAEKATGLAIRKETVGRRAGDPAVLVASSAKAKEVLGWVPKHTEIVEIIASAWKFHETHKEGYNK
ncbi:MAG TPA: UDP-glucose 4-epimerase GalE [Clostridiaceae bacterium]|nr:UDP-glucose 4-epimerase GalE [Clostridiaceae bacterium]